MEVCKECCSDLLDFKITSKEYCDKCGKIKDVTSTYIFDDEIDRLFYWELGGEG
jgi:hypothetical protein